VSDYLGPFIGIRSVRLASIIGSIRAFVGVFVVVLVVVVVSVVAVQPTSATTHIPKTIGISFFMPDPLPKSR
jgi:hypothetical protein